MSQHSILVVEDEGIVAMDIQARLRSLGYAVAGHATNGEDAIALARNLRPDLVLMDIMIEGDMDGIETARRISLLSGPPVVYLTAYADERTLSRAKLTGPLGYVIKPFEDRDLKLAIEMALYKHQVEARLAKSERTLATTLDSIAEAVVSADAAGAVTFVNPAAAELLGMDASEARGRQVLGLFTVLDPETREQVTELEEICGIGVGNAGCEDMLLVTPSGVEVPVSLSVSPIWDGEGGSGARGALAGRVVVIRNVSAKKRAEAELKASVQALGTAFRQTVRALSSMAEKRDPYTAGHQQRVGRLACAMGREMGLDADRLEGLEVSGTLHDVGKVYVPAEILAKPAKLSHMEMGIMKSHSEVGFEILKEVAFPWPVARTVLEHHERLDGSGYPGGLKGQDICLEARILAVADVVEAMSSHRPYRASLGLEQALAEITGHRGTRYDPEAVDACLRLFAERGFTFDEPRTESAAAPQPAEE